jgi:hypothetical protein
MDALEQEHEFMEEQHKDDEKRHGSRTSSSSSEPAILSRESRIGETEKDKKQVAGSKRLAGNLFVKSRPRQKLPTQSRTAHLLDTPPSATPPPTLLQLMAGAWSYSSSRSQIEAMGGWTEEEGEVLALSVAPLLGRSHLTFPREAATTAGFPSGAVGRCVRSNRR